MRVLGLIPARGGSKGVPRKNLRLLGGRPLLQYTTDVAVAARSLANVVVSTEDADVAHCAESRGIRVIDRPGDLATDEAPMVPVAQHAVRVLEAQGERYDAICILQPTCPLRRPADVDGAVQLLAETGADSVISFVDVGERHPARMKLVLRDLTVVDPPFGEQVEGQRRQELMPLYLREGSIYLTRRDVLMEGNTLKGTNCRAWIVPQERACNIDTEFDLFLAEQWLRYASMQSA